MWDYTDTVKKHFLEPANVGVVENANAVGEVGSLSCGDALKLTLRINKEGIIEDARFQTFGCASAIASSSVLTELVKGMTISDARKITNQEIADALGGLPKEKIHCSVMGQEALEKAIANYYGTPLPMQEGEVVCHCFGITDKTLIEAVKSNGLNSVDQVTHHLKAGGGCGNCHGEIEQILRSVVGEKLEDAVPSAQVETHSDYETLTPFQRVKRIEETVNTKIRPALVKDGGDLELIDITENVVKVRLVGACATCSMSKMTLKQHVESILQTSVSRQLIVEEV